MRYMKWIAGLVVWLAVCQLPALVGIGFVYSNMAWYQTLQKPLLTPPDMVFGMVWSVLYVLVGLAAARAFRSGLNERTEPAMMLLLVQLVLNALWTPVYFGLHSFAGAVVILVFMLGEGIYLHRAIKRLDKKAAVLLLPYWGWLVFASYLTIGFWGVNG
jgi:tryptophan-rich sensory protein